MTQADVEGLPLFLDGVHIAACESVVDVASAQGYAGSGGYLLAATTATAASTSAAPSAAATGSTTTATTSRRRLLAIRTAFRCGA